MSTKEVTYHQAQCDKCQEIYEGDEYTAWGDPGMAVEDATNNGDWFERMRLIRIEPPTDDFPHERRVYETVELLCRRCQKCDVCSTDMLVTRSEVDDNHLVCVDHEEHEFTEVIPA